ncbi:hypothetical protein GRI33_06140 [Brucella sp. BO3]|uniref:hypothetical protein n=1 Tax=unclassified Brucella TaxID=2632610 RepID=UPI00084FA618|nr:MULTISPECIES: hypothetical protein [unclassified Brucella]OEI83697.1 hypothetical protein BA060_06890 [Brucella sp. B13-0095]QMV26529.1 hypothetical protein GRI33_06140 [Brucella sp. BO3]
MTHLIDRLSKLDAPCRECDLGIGLAIAGWALRDEGPFGTIDVPEEGSYPNHPGSMYPAFTESLDVAFALAEKLFPGTEYDFTNLHNIVRVTIEMNGEYGGFHGEHINSLPIAICIAVIKAHAASPKPRPLDSQS